MLKETIYKPGHSAQVRIDLHVHTALGSACAELHNPETIPDTMDKKVLNGIVITEHNRMWPDERIKEINSRLPHGRRIYSGVEVSTSLFHVIVIGLDNSKGIYPGIEYERLIALANENQAATILVHPYHTSGCLCSNKAFVGGVDSIEVASTMTRDDIRSKTIALCLCMGLVPVAGSDAHCSENLGKVYTCFPYLPDNEKDLAEMIKKGMGTPMAKEGNVETVIL